MTRSCSNVLIEGTKSITLFIILDLIHLATWADLSSIWKYIYYLPTGSNFAVVYKVNKRTYMAPISCAWLFVVELVVMLYFFWFFTGLYVVIICDVSMILDGILGKKIILFFVNIIGDKINC